MAVRVKAALTLLVLTAASEYCSITTDRDGTDSGLHGAVGEA